MALAFATIGFLSFSTLSVAKSSIGSEITGGLLTSIKKQEQQQKELEKYLFSYQKVPADQLVYMDYTGPYSSGYNYALPYKISDIPVYNTAKSVAIVVKNQKFGAINKKGELIIPFKYDYLGNFTYFGEYAYAKLNDKFGVIDLDEKIIIPFKYDYIDDIREDLVLVRLNKKHGIFDQGIGKEVISPEYDEPINLKSQGNATYTGIAKKDGKIFDITISYSKNSQGKNTPNISIKERK